MCMRVHEWGVYVNESVCEDVCWGVYMCISVWGVNVHECVGLECICVLIKSMWGYVYKCV